MLVQHERVSHKVFAELLLPDFWCQFAASREMLYPPYVIIDYEYH